MIKKPTSGGILLRWIGRVLGATFGAMLGYVGGMEEGTLFLALIFASLGIAVGGFLGPYVAYLVAGVLMVPFMVLAALGLGVYTVALAVLDLFRRDRQGKAECEPKEE